MKILVNLHSVPPLRWVGGELMTLRLCELLRERGHTVDIYASEAPIKKPLVYNEFTVKSAGYLYTELVATYDVVITHPEIRHTITRHLGNNTRIPYVGIVHNLNPTTIRSIDRWTPTLTVGNSFYTVAKLHRWTDHVIMVYPPISIPEIPTGTPTDVLQVNVSADKGAGIFDYVTDALPNQPFTALLGGHGVQIPPQRDNVTIIPSKQDIASVYAQAKVVMSPSISETFGMVVAESVLRGIPTVLTNLPSHYEIAGDSALYPATTKQWASDIQRLCTDTAYYQQKREETLSQRSRLIESITESEHTWITAIESLST